MAEAGKLVKIVLVTGYLGAGKTTLLNYILSNDRDLRAAVIVNDIGEVNIDEALIRDGGLSQADSVIPLTNGCICCTLSDDLAEQLGGIAATGDFDYIVIEASGICEPMPIAYTIAEFCERSAAAAGQTAGVDAGDGSDDGAGAGVGDDVAGDGADAGVGAEGADGVRARLALDNIVAVVDCARMIDEFDAGKRLLADDLEEDDVESLLIEQIEFCSTVVLNKADLVSEEQLGEVRAIVRSLQKDAVMVEAEHGVVPLEELLDTGRFDFDAIYQSATWLDIMMGATGEGGEDGEGDEGARGHGSGCGHDHDHDHDHDCDCDHDSDHDHDHGHGHDHDHDHDRGRGGHHHHHHHHHGEHDEGLEYGFSSFVYERRRPFSLEALPSFTENWPETIIRTKGMVWIDEQPDVCFLLEQAGRQRHFIDNGEFVAALPEEEREQVLDENPGIRARWDDECGDRQTLLVFIGRDMDRAAIEESLDACLTDWIR